MTTKTGRAIRVQWEGRTVPGLLIGPHFSDGHVQALVYGVKPAQLLQPGQWEFVNDTEEGDDRG